jgi:hypothetical protein
MWVQALKTYQSIVAVRPDALGAMYGKMSGVAQRLVEEVGEVQQRKGSAVIKKNAFAVEVASLKVANQRLEGGKQRLVEEKQQFAAEGASLKGANQRLVEEKQQLVEEKQQFQQHLSKFAATNPDLEKQLPLMTYASAKGHPLSIMLEGQEEGDRHQVKMGVYELVEGKEVNARGVWKRTGKEHFMYYSSTNKWRIGNQGRMEAGKNTGWLNVASTALTPDKITETWKVDGVEHKWHDAPKVRAQLA